jgi:hypothetical protein
MLQLSGILELSQLVARPPIKVKNAEIYFSQKVSVNASLSSPGIRFIYVICGLNLDARASVLSSSASNVTQNKNFESTRQVVLQSRRSHRQL